MQGRIGAKGDRHVKGKQNKDKINWEVRGQLENQDDIKKISTVENQNLKEKKENGEKELIVRGRRWEERQSLKRWSKAEDWNRNR